MPGRKITPAERLLKWRARDLEKVIEAKEETLKCAFKANAVLVEMLFKLGVRVPLFFTSDEDSK